MKKFLALVMAMLMILAMGTVAFADEVTYGKSDPVNLETKFSVKITKQYASGDKVSETLTFTPEADTSNPGSENLEVGSIVVENGTPKSSLSITIPSLSKEGTYTWTIKEDKGNTAGVKYSDEIITVNAVVGFDNDNQKYKVISANAYIKATNGDKTYAINNAYSQVGSFTVEKVITGTGASQNDSFDIKVTLTKPSGKTIGSPIKVGGVETVWGTGDTFEKTITIKSGTANKYTFENIPEGVTVSISEDDQNGYENKGITVNGKAGSSATIVTGNKDEFVVTNEKNVENIKTGISMDNAPYMMIMALVVLAGAAMLLKKRAYND